jgi:hypothetical protein
MTRRLVEIHTLHNEGFTITAIAEQTAFDAKDVRVSSAADLPRPTGECPRRLDQFTPYLVRRPQGGRHVAAFLHAELKALGYRGCEQPAKQLEQCMVEV